MEKFNILNTFFNIISNNESAYIRDLFSDYQYLQEFKKWLNDKNISFECLTAIDEEAMKMIRPHMKSFEVDILLHIPFEEEVKSIIHNYEDRLQVVMIPSLGKKIKYSLDIHDEEIDYYEIEDVFHYNDLSFLDPFPSFLTALDQVDEWGGALIFSKDNEVFYPISSKEESLFVSNVLKKKDSIFYLLKKEYENSYFLHLSDLHLGRDKSQKGLNQLTSSLNSLIPKLSSTYPIKALITGDLMDSPNRKNMYLANDFMNDLKKKYKANVTFILGNHDVIVHGFNLLRRQKSKVVAYLLGENIKVFEQEKIIIIKIDTTSEGNLARGKVGIRQLNEIDDELEAISHLEEYTMIVMLHHHVYPIDKAQFLKTKWHEKTFINHIIETSKELIDANLLIEWLDKKNIHYVLHGHKHLPFFRKIDDKYIVSGGSSTGGLKESKSKYISYNLLKYDVKEKIMKTCLIFYDDKAKADCQRVEVYLFEEEKYEVNGNDEG